MADRFPSLEDFDSGGKLLQRIRPIRSFIANLKVAETKGDNIEVGSPAGDDFLSRERAALGDDAGQFASSNDKAAFVDDDEDLLGGGVNNDGEEVEEFESSYPAIDTRNEVI